LQCFFSRRAQFRAQQPDQENLVSVADLLLSSVLVIPSTGMDRVERRQNIFQTESAGPQLKFTGLQWKLQDDGWTSALRR